MILSAGLLAVAGCWEFPAYDEPVDGPYRLFAADNEDQVELSYNLGGGSLIGRVDQTVFGVGWDAKYIVAERHPDRNGHPDKDTTEYFYVIRALDGPYKNPADSVRGPFDAFQFNAEKARLGLPPFRREDPRLR